MKREKEEAALEVKEFFQKLAEFCGKKPITNEKGVSRCVGCFFRDFCYSPPDHLDENVSDLNAVYDYFTNSP